MKRGIQHILMCFLVLKVVFSTEIVSNDFFLGNSITSKDRWSATSKNEAAKEVFVESGANCNECGGFNNVKTDKTTPEIFKLKSSQIDFHDENPLINEYMSKKTDLGAVEDSRKKNSEMGKQCKVEHNDSNEEIDTITCLLFILED